MPVSSLTAAHFHDELAAYDFVEAKLWPHVRFAPSAAP